jgi:hypothetical protein
VKKEKAELEAGGESDNLKWVRENNPDYIKWLDEYTVMLEEGLKNAPDSVSPVPDKPEVKRRDTYDWVTGKVDGYFNGFDIHNEDSSKHFSLLNNGGEYFNIESDFDFDSRGANLYYSNTNHGPAVMMSGGGYGMMGTGSEEEVFISPVEIRTVSYTEYKANSAAIEASVPDGFFSFKGAVEKVDDFLSQAGITDMKIANMSLIYLVSNDFLNVEQETDRKTAHTNYEQIVAELKEGKHSEQVISAQVSIEMARYVNGVQVSSVDDSIKYNMNPNEAPPENTGRREIPQMTQNWVYEEFNMSVTEHGILILVWRSPYEVIETIVSESNLISFDDTVSIFENMFRIKYSGWKSWLVEEYKRNGHGDLTLNHEGEITRVTLSMRRITEQNSIERGLLVPVWDFYGTVKTYSTLKGETHSMSSHPWSGEPLMTINAVDGTIIDLAKGY